MLTPDEIESLAKRHGATSYRNRADTQHPAYGFTEAGLQGLITDVHKQYTELIRQMLEALETYQAFIDDAHIIDGQWHWLDDAKPATTAARARLGEKT